MQFVSDNAASVHPAIWRAMQEADGADAPYDGDGLSARLDDAFSTLFDQPCVALWAVSGTAANCLALSAMVEPHSAVVCHREAHIECDEGGAPGFFLHGAKLMPADGANAKLTPAAIDALLAPIRRDVHRVWPQALSITQASERGCVYRPDELEALGQCADAHGLALHMDGARFANAVAFLRVAPAQAASGMQALSFGFTKNGAMNAEAIVFFEPGLADVVRHRRKRAGHLLSKGRFLAAQLHAMLADDLWLTNARAANAAAGEIAEAAGERVLHPVEANELFLRLARPDRETLRAQGFGFYDWGEDGARFVTAWDNRAEDVAALARALREL